MMSHARSTHCIFHHMGRENQEGNEPCFSKMWWWWWRENNRNVGAVVYSFIIKIRPSHFYCFPSTTTTTTTTFLSFSLHHHHHRHHIFIVFPPPPPPPPPPHFYCFPSTTPATFLLFSLHHHRHISIVFPSPPLYIFRLANHLADVHQLDHIQRRQYLHEWKLQPKVKAVVYESEADNSAKKSLN